MNNCDQRSPNSEQSSAILWWLVVGGLFVLTITWQVPQLHWLLDGGTALLRNGYDKIFIRVFSDPIFWIVLFASLYLEQRIPAERRGTAFGASFFQDLTWFFYEAFLTTLVVGTYVFWLKQVFVQQFGFLTTSAVVQSPVWLRFVVGLLLLDFLYWFQHWLNHKVPWFWYFHEVHHSQRELNFFSDFRYHIFEYFVGQTILVLPFLVLQLDESMIVGFLLFKKWYTRFCHANIRTNLGPLRHLLVTPQSHRVHHSCEARHFDKNFGSIFTFWDQIFGTQHSIYSDYPPTGIADGDFPHEQSLRPKDLLITPVRQLIYPLHKIARSLNSRLRILVGTEKHLNDF